ncbi:MAG: microcin C ABC transporter permease YejB [Pseudomonadota bacterium]|jgi:microcin C transport system permease protein
MWSYLLKRLLILIPTLLGVITLTFVVTQFVPGGPVEQALVNLEQDGSQGAEASGGGAMAYSASRGLDAKQIRQLEALYGFDKPPLERYWHMLVRFAQFDLGESYFRHQTVWELILSKLPVSISLGLWTFLLTYLVSVPLGVAKAVKDGTRFDFVTSVLVLLGYAVPGFVLGLMLLVLFGGGSFWDVFPLRGLTSDNWADLSAPAKVFDYLWHMALPVIASVTGAFAIKTMLTKNSFLEESRRQYVLTAYAKGLPDKTVVWKHIMRNALLPLITGFPAAFISAFFSGSLLIETLFSLDGLGLLSYEAVKARDYPVVLGTLYIFTLLGLLTKLVGDIGYVLADPRIKFDAQER